MACALMARAPGFALAQAAEGRGTRRGTTTSPPGEINRATAEGQSLGFPWRRTSAGENAIYLDTQLKAFRPGRRADATMGPIAAGLDDATIRAAADWCGSIGIAPAAP